MYTNTTVRQEDTVPVRFARNVVRFAGIMGAQEAPLLEAAGLDSARLDDLDGWLSDAHFSALLEAAVVQTGDPDFGIRLGMQAQPGALSIVGFLMLSAPTLGEALGAMVRYTPLIGILRNAHLDPGGSGQPAAFVMTAPTSGALAQALRQPLEAAMTMIGVLSTAVTGRRLPVLSIAFVHARPATGTATHEEAFGVVPTFDAPTYRIEFEASALRWPGLSASVDLHASFTREADLALARLASDACSRVAAAVERRLQGAVPTLAEVAADLALGERTLQRALSDEGTSFQKVVDEVRCDVAVRHLGEEALTILEVGFMLGYSSPSAFHRAFKRWTGLAPSAYRMQEHAA